MIRRLVLIVVLSLVASVFATAWLCYQPLSIKQAGLIRIMPGANFEALITELSRDEQLGNNAETLGRQWLLRAYGRYSGLSQKLRVGEYPYYPSDNLINIVQRVERAKSVQHSVTLVEGWSFNQLRQMFASLPVLQHQLAGLSDQQVEQALGLTDSKIEGWLAPDTYYYVLGDSDLDVVKRAYTAQQQILQQEWQKRAKDLPYQTPYDALIMASLIEKETAVKSEMPRIAGVFVLRLQKKMRLQTDPTVIYAMGERYQAKFVAAIWLSTRLITPIVMPVCHPRQLRCQASKQYKLH